MKAKRFAWQQAVSLLLSLSLLIIPAVSCDDTTPTGSGGEKPAGNLIAASGCKAFAYEAGGNAPGADQECVAYVYDRASELNLMHINAAFNCCPGEITAEIDIAGHVITITEREESQLCRCNCLYDVEYTIENLPPGEYTIQVTGPYQEEGDDPLEFTVNLSLEPEGLFCVDRNHYPWFENLPDEPRGTLLDMYGCKKYIKRSPPAESEDFVDCIKYTYINGSTLLLEHRNAGFNCCPNIGTEISIDGSSITIYETDLGLCDCSCLYDLTFQIIHLPPGEYTISVIEPLLQEGDEKLEFTVDLTSTPAGEYCVERTHYPWPAAGAPSGAGGTLLDIVGCKSATGIGLASGARGPAGTTPADQDCFEYDYGAADSALLITHINAGFNCCPVIDFDIDRTESTITITEIEIQGECRCLCLFDLYYQIDGVPPGTYTITFENPYVPAGEEQLECTVDLILEPSGTHCVTRTSYPWG